MDMLRRIGKQSGESVESVLKAGQDKESVMTENHVTDWDNVKATVMLRVFCDMFSAADILCITSSKSGLLHTWWC